MKGSAYLFVLGSMLVVMILLVSALKQSTATTKKVVHTLSHVMAANNRDSCITFLFHRIKVWPFESRPELILENSDLSLPSGTCSWETEYRDSRNFEFVVTGVHNDIETRIRLKIRGGETHRGIQWRYGVEES